MSDQATGGQVGQVTWTFSSAAAELQFLAESQQLIQTYTVTIDDGHGGTVSQVVSISITGTNDGAIISGTDDGSVDEDTVAVATGTLTASDVDNTANAFQAASGSSTYGTWSIDAAGNWSYTLDDTNPVVDALNDGDPLSDSFQVASEDGTLHTISISITGTNDGAIISGTDTGAVTKAGGVDNGTPGTPTAEGDLNADDVDNPDDTWTPVLVPIPGTNGYGTFEILTNGLWLYTLDNANPLVQELNGSATLTDSFTFFTEDGTSEEVTITINGANDTPDARPDVANLTNHVLRSTASATTELVGTISVLTNDSDIDAGETELLRVTEVDGVAIDQTAGAETAVAGVYGTLFIKADGTYRYVLDNNDPDTLALSDSEIVTESFNYLAANGTGPDNEEFRCTGDSHRSSPRARTSGHQ